MSDLSVLEQLETATVPGHEHSQNRLLGEFLEAVERIEGVEKVVAYAPERGASASCSFLVVVPTLDCSASERVLELKTALLRRYPTAQLDVRLKGLKERGLASGQADQLL